MYNVSVQNFLFINCIKMVESGERLGEKVERKEDKNVVKYDVEKKGDALALPERIMVENQSCGI